jgi:hypothetical protein
MWNFLAYYDYPAREMTGFQTRYEDQDMKNKLAQRMVFTLALAIGAVSASTGILAQNQDMMMGSGHMMD